MCSKGMRVRSIPMLCPACGMAWSLGMGPYTKFMTANGMRAGGLVPHRLHAGVGGPRGVVPLGVVPMGPSPHAGQYQCLGCGCGWLRIGQVWLGARWLSLILIHTLVTGVGLSK